MTTSSEDRREGAAAAAIARAVRTLRALAHPQRLKIVDVVRREGPLPVAEISRRVRLTQAMTSQHLNRLREVGVLAARRQGREVWYELADRRCGAVLDCIAKKGA